LIKGIEELEGLRKYVEGALGKYVDLARRLSFPSTSYMAVQGAPRTSLEAAQCLQHILLELSGGKTPRLARYAVDYFALETFFITR